MYLWIQLEFFTTFLYTQHLVVKFGYFCGKDKDTTVESKKLCRLPLYYNMDEYDQDRAIAMEMDFLQK